MTARREVALLLISSLLVCLLFGTHLGPVHASDDMPSSSTSPELSYVMTINNTDAQNHRAHIPTVIPLVYELDCNLKSINHCYLGDEEKARKAIESVALQGRPKKEA
jgi:hypothetical protein